LLFAGILQGLLFALIIIFNKKYNSKSNYFLAALIISFSLNNLQFYVLDINIYNNKFFYSFIYLPFSLIIPVFLFNYIIFSLDSDYKTTLKQKLLFVPFLLGVGVTTFYKTVVVYRFGAEATSDFLFVSINSIEVFGILFNQIIYSYLFFLILKFEKDNKEYKTDVIKIRLNWLKKILLFLLVLTLIWLFITLKIIISNKSGNFYPLWIGISFLIYWLGYVGIYKFGIIQERKNLKKHSCNRKTTDSVVEDRKSTHVVALEKLLIEERKYLDSDLTLDKIAEEMNLSNSYLSRMINTELGIGFIEYVNTLRVEEAKSCLLNPEFSKYNLVSIGMEAGFNSKSTFYASFKKITGYTPSEFKRNAKKNTEMRSAE
jgi:AraC-like DNA-binding protein